MCLLINESHFKLWADLKHLATTSCGPQPREVYASFRNCDQLK